MIQLIKKCDSESAHVTHAFTCLSMATVKKKTFIVYTKNTWLPRLKYIDENNISTTWKRTLRIQNCISNSE